MQGAQRNGSIFFPGDLHYDRGSHLWVRRSGSRAILGLDALGQAAMGDVVYLLLEQPDTNVVRGQSIGSVEAAKMISPIHAPVSGRITRQNEAVLRNPTLINSDPYGNGWLLEIELSRWSEEEAELLNGAAHVEQWANLEIARYRNQGWIE